MNTMNSALINDAGQMALCAAIEQHCYEISAGTIHLGRNHASGDSRLWIKHETVESLHASGFYTHIIRQCKSK